MVATGWHRPNLTKSNMQKYACCNYSALRYNSSLILWCSKWSVDTTSPAEFICTCMCANYLQTHTLLIEVIVVATALVTQSVIISLIKSSLFSFSNTPSSSFKLFASFHCFPWHPAYNESQVSVWRFIFSTLHLQSFLLLHSFPHVSLSSILSDLPVGLVVGLANRNASKSQLQTSNGQRIIIVQHLALHAALNISIHL